MEKAWSKVYGTYKAAEGGWWAIAAGSITRAPTVTYYHSQVKGEQLWKVLTVVPARSGARPPWRPGTRPPWRPPALAPARRPPPTAAAADCPADRPLPQKTTFWEV